MSAGFRQEVCSSRLPTAGLIHILVGFRKTPE